MKKAVALALFSLFSTLATASEIPALRCLGTVPFWGVKTQVNGTLTYADPITMGVTRYLNAELLNAAGTSGDFAFQIKAVDSTNKSLKLNVIKTVCNDGMSDEVYTYSVLVETEIGMLFGCCNKAD